ncbi:MAG: DUF937 domain-containing protein [Cyanobacteria bacterium P01_F01_bin.86]
MGLFDQVVSAINDPDKQASASQIGQVFSAVQQMSQQNNTSPDAMQTAASVLGSYMRSSLKEKRNSQGDGVVQALVQQGAQSGLAGQVLGQLLNSGQQAQVVQAISQKTGMNSQQIQAMLPMLVPVVMQMLNSGSNNQGAAAGSNNPVLNAFLDADGDGDVDMGDMLRMAGRFAG